MQWDYGKFVLQQLDYSPSFCTSDTAPRWLSARRKLGLRRSLIVKYHLITNMMKFSRQMIIGIIAYGMPRLLSIALAHKFWTFPTLNL